MAKVKVILDPIGNTMNIWWGNPKSAFISEEVDDPDRNDVIIKDKNGKPVSLEVIGVFPEELNVSELIRKAIGKKTDQPFLLHS